MNEIDRLGIALLTVALSFLAFAFAVGINNDNVRFECLSYGYPQYNTALFRESYCTRRVFETDEVRTLEELRMKEKSK